MMNEIITILQINFISFFNMCGFHIFSLFRDYGQRTRNEFPPRVPPQSPRAGTAPAHHWA